MRGPTNRQRMLAVMPGTDPEQRSARARVAGRFLESQALAGNLEWGLIRRIMQCIDTTQPVFAGPVPPAPPALVALPAASYLGAGFFALLPRSSDDDPRWYEIDPEAPYLKWFSPSGGEGGAGEARFYVPIARRAVSPMVRAL